MASGSTKIELRLRWFARAVLFVATYGRRCGFGLPHSLVTFVTNRSWPMRLGDGAWRSIRIDGQGRVLR